MSRQYEPPRECPEPQPYGYMQEDGYGYVHPPTMHRDIEELFEFAREAAMECGIDHIKATQVAERFRKKL